MTHPVFELMERLGVVPVVTFERPDHAAEVGAALAAGGLPIIEVTFRRPGAEHAVEALARRGEVTVGAGTIVTPDQADIAVDAGASFLVSPGLDREVVRRAEHHSVPVLPGVLTPTEIQRAIRWGLSVVKLFPVRALGGPALVAALAAPFPELRFVPTGGIDADGVGDYLRLAAVLAVGGSWLAPPATVRERRWGEITERARKARSARSDS